MDQTQLDARVQELFDASEKLPGVVVGVQQGDRVMTCALGVADVETGRAMTADTVFHLASVSKVYNATLIMSLVDDGRLDLDAPVTAYLPDFAVSDADTTERVALRHLITHTSGLDGDKFEEFGQGDDALGRYVDDCRTLGQVCPLGATWSYCNSGVNIAGHVAAVVSGSSWDDALRERVLQPSGAQRSGTRPEDVVWWPLAVPHVTDGGAQVPLRAWQADRSAGPAGGVLASAEDVLRFVALHARKGKGVEGTTVLRPETADLMLTPAVQLPEGAEDDTHAGLGWALRVLADGRRVVSHGGDLIGTHAMMTWAPEADLTVVVLGNGDGMESVARPILDDLLREAGIPPAERLRFPDQAPEVDVARRAGTYRTVAAALDLVAAGDHLDGTLRILDPIIRERLPAEHREQHIELRPVSDAQYLTALPGDDTLIPGVFFENEGRQFLHLGGRAMQRVE
jgi:CubicO group peptidase (beta-lactamase class C family)